MNSARAAKRASTYNSLSKNNPNIFYEAVGETPNAYVRQTYVTKSGDHLYGVAGY